MLRHGKISLLEKYNFKKKDNFSVTLHYINDNDKNHEPFLIIAGPENT